jgi:hypothetical protein
LLTPGTPTAAGVMAEKATVTGVVYQPCALGPVLGAPLTLVGGDASRLSVTDRLALPPALVAPVQ